MSETPEHPTETTGAISAQRVAPQQPAPPPAQPPHRPSRLNQVAAWVGIVAGVVFVVAVIFGTGFMMGKHSGGGPRFDRAHDAAEFHHRGPMGPRGPGFAPPSPGQPEQPGTPTTTTPRP